MYGGLQAVAMVAQGLVHLVANATCIDAVTAGGCGEIVTTLENRVARGPVFLSCKGAVHPVPLGTFRQLHAGCQWSWHNGTGYLLPRSLAGHTQGVLVTNGNGGAATSTAMRAREIDPPDPHFSLAVSHTPGYPATSWIAVPGVPLADMGRVAAGSNNVTVAANGEGMQAVWDARRLQLFAAVWRPGTTHLLNLSAPAGLGTRSIEASRPCVVQIRQSSQCGSFTVTASDPTNNPSGGTLSLSLAGISGATVCVVPPCPCSTQGDVTAVVLALPGGWDAGKSASVTCIPHMCA